MSKNFHRDYAESVGHFCQSLPPDRNVTAQEVDTYFCAFKCFYGSFLSSSRKNWQFTPRAHLHCK